MWSAIWPETSPSATFFGGVELVVPTWAVGHEASGREVVTAGAFTLGAVRAGTTCVSHGASQCWGKPPRQQRDTRDNDASLPCPRRRGSGSLIG